MYDLRRAVLADLWALPGVRPFLEGATETTTGAVVWVEDDGLADIFGENVQLETDKICISYEK